MSAIVPTSAQKDYLELLCRKLRTSLEEAIADAGLDEPLDIGGASKLIDRLKEQLDGQQEGEGKQPDQHAGVIRTGREGLTASGPSPATLNATELRLIAKGEMAERPGMSEDENWILYRLAKLTDLEQAIGEPVEWVGANVGEAIRVDHLVEYFGSIEAVATAFKVSVGTVRSGWGGVLPANRVHEAAWMTRGYVRPPR